MSGGMLFPILQRKINDRCVCTEVWMICSICRQTSMGFPFDLCVVRFLFHSVGTTFAWIAGIIFYEEVWFLLGHVISFKLISCERTNRAFHVPNAPRWNGAPSRIVFFLVTYFVRSSTMRPWMRGRTMPLQRSIADCFGLEKPKIEGNACVEPMETILTNVRARDGQSDKEIGCENIRAQRVRMVNGDRWFEWTTFRVVFVQCLWEIKSHKRTHTEYFTCVSFVVCCALSRSSIRRRNEMIAFACTEMKKEKTDETRSSHSVSPRINGGEDNA